MRNLEKVGGCKKTSRSEFCQLPSNSSETYVVNFFFMIPNFSILCWWCLYDVIQQDQVQFFQAKILSETKAESEGFKAKECWVGQSVNMKIHSFKCTP